MSDIRAPARPTLRGVHCMALLSQLTEPLNWGDHDAGTGETSSKAEAKGEEREREWKGRMRRRGEQDSTQEGG